MNVLQNRCSETLPNVQRKTPVSESLFNTVAGLGYKKRLQNVFLLTLKDPFISKSCIEIKALKAFIKPFEAPQRSVKTKI